jgi:hypothetical protein
MHVTHSREHTNPMRIFRAAVLNNVPVPETARALLQAQGVDTQELEVRLLQQIGMH